VKIISGGYVLRPLEDTELDEAAIYAIFQDWFDDGKGPYTRRRASIDLTSWVKGNSKVIRPLVDGDTLAEQTRWIEGLLLLLDGVPIGFYELAVKGRMVEIRTQAVIASERGKGHGSMMGRMYAHYTIELLNSSETRAKVIESQPPVRAILRRFGLDEGATEIGRDTKQPLINARIDRVKWDARPAESAIITSEV